MTKTYVASTLEIDDIDAAVAEIKEQLHLDAGLLKNSVAIISCHYEFVVAGVVKAIYDALPCDMVGSISTPLAAGETIDSVLLSIMLITSDEAEFVTALTEPVTGGAASKSIFEGYKSAAAAKVDKPSLILAYVPFIAENAGDTYVQAISEASGGVPCFGTAAIDDTLEFSNTFMIYNGKTHKDRFGMILAYGLQPKFFVANISLDRILDKSAVITKSEGHVIMELNGRPVEQFLEDVGLAKASENSFGLASLPFLLDYNDGTPKVSKIFIQMTPDGYALCAGTTPEGSNLQIGMSDKNDVILTTETTMDTIMAEMNSASGLIIYSCIARNVTLGADMFDEMNVIVEKVAGKIPFLMAYSGGEMCPTQHTGGNAVNRFHNNAFVACLF